MIMDDMGNPLSGAYFIMGLVASRKKLRRKRFWRQPPSNVVLGASGVTHDVMTSTDEYHDIMMIIGTWMSCWYLGSMDYFTPI